MMTNDEATQLAELHATQPCVGDFWHEMYSPICAVVAVEDDHVLLCVKYVPSSDGRYWTWSPNVSDLVVKSLEEFSQWLRYDSMSDKFWCRVIPRRDAWLAEKIIGEPTDA
jgi:hypothetical protein